MEAQKSRTKYWIYCFAWLALMIFMLATPAYRQWFWLALPGVSTYFALAMDIM
ncbi:MAG: hypothetical protein J0I09_01660 [Sphingobacteriia bacterium]|nr:hypothetical protein [Sphingobacteriia bacterium]